MPGETAVPMRVSVEVEKNSGLKNEQIGRFIVLVSLLLFALFVAWQIYNVTIVPAGEFHWDEAAHALRGKLIANDFAERNWLALAYDTYRQVYWPPLFSWLLAGVFTVSAPTAVSARTLNLLLFVMTAVILYGTGLRMGKRHKEVTAVVASVLFLTSPALARFAAQVMLEIPGLLFLAFAIWVVFSMNKHPQKNRYYFLLGMAVALTYFAKTNYGILLFLVILISSFIDVRFHLKQLLTRQTFWFLLPLVVIFSIWFAYPSKINATLFAMVNQPFGIQDPFSVDGFLFYPRALLTMAGSWWMALIWLVAFLLSLRYWRNRNVRFLQILILLQLTLGQIHHTKVDRHLFPLFPALFLLMGFVIAQSWSWGSHWRRWLPRLGTGLLLLFAIVLFHRSLAPKLANVDRERFEYIKHLAQTHDPVLIIGSMEMGNPHGPLVDWELVTDSQVLQVDHSGTTIYFEQDRAATLLAQKIPLPFIRDNLVSVLQRAETPNQARSLYLGLHKDAGYSNGRDGLVNFLKYEGAMDWLDTAVLISSTKASARYPESEVAPALQQLGLQHVESKQIGDQIVSLYQKDEH